VGGQQKNLELAVNQSSANMLSLTFSIQQGRIGTAKPKTPAQHYKTGKN
jgi:hypothetical protein